MSPEQAGGRIEDLGPASDIYGLGATLFAVLTGRPPVEGENVVEVLSRVRSGAIDLPRSLVPDVPRPLEAICLKALALRPEDRYPQAKALADDVERWLADEPVSAYARALDRPPSPLGTTQPDPGRDGRDGRAGRPGRARHRRRRSGPGAGGSSRSRTSSSLPPTGPAAVPSIRPTHASTWRCRPWSNFARPLTPTLTSRTGPKMSRYVMSCSRRPWPSSAPCATTFAMIRPRGPKIA